VAASWRGRGRVGGRLLKQSSAFGLRNSYPTPNPPAPTHPNVKRPIGTLEESLDRVRLIVVQTSRADV